MEHSTLAIAAFLEAGCSADLQDWSWDHGVGGIYATDCWHISCINIVLAVSYSFLADFQDGHVCCAATVCFQFLYCDMGEYVTKCNVDSSGRIALNSFTSCLMKANVVDTQWAVTPDAPA